MVAGLIHLCSEEKGLNHASEGSGSLRHIVVGLKEKSKKPVTAKKSRKRSKSSKTASIQKKQKLKK